MDNDRESAVRSVLTRMSERISAVAPRGWKRAELRGYALDGQGVGHRGLIFDPEGSGSADDEGWDDDGDWDGGEGIHDGLRELHKLTEATEELTVELELEARGRYRAVLSERFGRTGERAFRYLREPDGRPPTQADEFLGASQAREAGDPAEAVALLRTYLGLLGELAGPGADLDLPLALPGRVRANAEADVGIPLPRDLGALYAVVDGDGGRGLLHGYGWMGLRMVADICPTEERWWVSDDWRKYELDSYVREHGSVHAIRRLRDHPAWIPFATDMSGDYLAVDMAPGPNGVPGQVILIGRHLTDGPVYVADSVTSLIRRQVETLASGAFEADEDGLRIHAGSLEQPCADYHETSTLRVSGRDAAPVRGLTSEIRELTVSDAPWVDLGSVRGAPALWRVSVDNCPGVDLAPLRDVPVEVLELSLARIDLSGLAGQHTLQRVVLRTEGERDLRPSKEPVEQKRFTPVDLRPLLSCPRLYALDVADCVVQDLAVLRDANGLRYLRMTRTQWDDLVSAGALPPSLAVADLAPEEREERKWFWSFDKAYKQPRPTLRDAVRWAAGVAGDSSDLRTVEGRFSAPRRR